MTTFTSTELAALAEQIPTKAIDRGLLFVKEVEFVKAADVQLSSDTVGLDAALAIAAAANAPFVSLSTLEFNGEMLRLYVAHEDDVTVLPDEVERVISEASFHEGDFGGLTLRWPAQGLIFEWTAASDWHDGFWEELMSARAGATEEAEAESAEEIAVHQAQIAELEAALAASEEFRAASVMKRRAVASAIASAIDEDLVGSWSFNQALKDANALANMRIFEFEQAFSQQIPELVKELAIEPEWQRARTDKIMREATLKFLTKKADGYRLGTGIVDQLMNATLMY